MRPVAALANCLWGASVVPSWLAFCRALKRPGETQRALLHQSLAQNAASAYGREHGFAEIRTYEEFANRVPLVDYDDVEPWIDRIKRGEGQVLTTNPVSHLIPTSGSTGGRKLIPFTPRLQRQFNRALGPWIADLMMQQPHLLFGPAYWSITPSMQSCESGLSAVPIGFADDTDYLGGIKGWLARRAVVAPRDVGQFVDLEEFRLATLTCLLKERELRLISIWHPSFLTLLLDAIPLHWEKLLALICKANRRRPAELERCDPSQPGMLWPRLRVISCWGDGSAVTAISELRRRFPNVLVQAKGLLATEAFVSIPFRGQHPLAVCSHFFEFMDAKGRLHLADALRENETYEVVATTAGGLWRYCLNDLVQVTGFVARTPSLRFLGRSGNVSDLCGEKLSEAFVAKAIEASLARWDITPRFVLLAPDRDNEGSRYTLYIEGTPLPGLAETLDTALRENPHYSYCRKLGQLLPVRVFRISERGYDTFVKQEMAQGRRLGDIKPATFSLEDGWSKLFCGFYV